MFRALLCTILLLVSGLIKVLTPIAILNWNRMNEMNEWLSRFAKLIKTVQVVDCERRSWPISHSYINLIFRVLFLNEKGIQRISHTYIVTNE